LYHNAQTPNQLIQAAQRYSFDSCLVATLRYLFNRGDLHVLSARCFDPITSHQILSARALLTPAQILWGIPRPNFFHCVR
jgi:hypothetical protein